MSTTELLTLPAWNNPPTPLSAWVEQLERGGVKVALEYESSGVCWLEVGAMRLRGYAVLENGLAEAINFELNAAEIEDSRAAIERAAEALGWEVHEDEDDGEDVEDD